jgi:hypothetical protein
VGDPLQRGRGRRDCRSDLSGLGDPGVLALLGLVEQYVLGPQLAIDVDQIEHSTGMGITVTVHLIDPEFLGFNALSQKLPCLTCGVQSTTVTVILPPLEIFFVGCGASRVILLNHLVEIACRYFDDGPSW